VKRLWNWLTGRKLVAVKHLELKRRPFVRLRCAACGHVWEQRPPKVESE
jgi:hypothetical protein